MTGLSLIYHLTHAQLVACIMHAADISSSMGKELKKKTYTHQWGTISNMLLHVGHVVAAPCDSLSSFQTLAVD